MRASQPASASAPRTHKAGMPRAHWRAAPCDFREATWASLLRLARRPARHCSHTEREASARLAFTHALYTSIQPTNQPSIHPFHPSNYLPVSLSVPVPIFFSISIYLPLYLSICVSVCLSIYLYLSSYLHLSIYISMSSTQVFISALLARLRACVRECPRPGDLYTVIL